MHGYNLEPKQLNKPKEGKSQHSSKGTKELKLVRTLIQTYSLRFAFLCLSTFFRKAEDMQLAISDSHLPFATRMEKSFQFFQAWIM